ncbi:plasmid replication protein RepC [Rhizobium sp. RU36D]|uniref:plasmid replication protein RepC n=1 Tax=Rhizobium sp. RU36D TaxID=1907415 RepID=UPI0009D8BC0E|nr:plasmid replication protein RepC [Rhizobium sp. RU36D]SMC71218.1 replication initiation protein RepC [Rhizobium sp. RU36D]
MQVGNVTTPFGRRAMTLGMLATQVTSATIAPGKSIDKWKLYRALCEARVRLGISDRALSLLNALLSFSPKSELSEENGLVVFPSNNQLSLRANGMAEATIRRHLAVLVQAGLLVRRDSANGKRYARRDEHGDLDEAFGFSLAPLLARAEEIEQIAADVVAERLHLQRLRERLTICRRDVAKLINTALEEGAPGDWLDAQAELRLLVGALPRVPIAQDLDNVLKSVEELRDRLVNRLQTLSSYKNIIGSPDQSERHIQNSNTESPNESEPAFEKRQEQKPKVVQLDPGTQLKAFPLSMVLRACPEISAYGPGGAISSWREMMAAAVLVRSMLGVSPSAYEHACEVMGPESAAVAVACILERGGEINSAGGYLRDLTRRAERGEFSLGPMLMALLRARGVSDRQAS